MFNRKEFAMFLEGISIQIPLGDSEILGQNRKGKIWQTYI